MIKRFQEARKFDVIELGKLRNLCHELGQVAYVFSDKTGTCAVPVLSLGHPWPSMAIAILGPWLRVRLTQNVMELKQLSIAGGMATAICFLHENQFKMI